MALLLGIFIGGWLLYTTVVEPASARAATLQRVIPEKAQNIEVLRAKCNEYVSLNDQLSNLKTQMAGRKTNFNLMGYLEALTAHNNLSELQKSMTTETLPLGDNDTWQEQIVTIKFENITVKQMIDFLRQIQTDQVGTSQPNAQIKAIQIEKSTTAQNFNTTLKIAILQPVS